MHEFWYDYAKPKYEEKAKLCSMDRSSFIVYIKTEDIYSAISRCWNKFDTLNYELETPLPEEKTELMKDEFSEKIMTEFAALRPKTYSNLTDDNDEKTKKQMAEKRVS